ncbi:hypothetical protein HDV05_001487, partial [Chytridiales sp. JEL 0842]
MRRNQEELEREVRELRRKSKKQEKLIQALRVSKTARDYNSQTLLGGRPHQASGWGSRYEVGFRHGAAGKGVVR